MRMLVGLVALATVAVAVAAVGQRAPVAAAAGVTAAVEAADAQPQQQVDDNDDTRVEVQLAVLGAAAFVVLVVGGAGYLLRKRLGLVAGPPEQGQGGHH